MRLELTILVGKRALIYLGMSIENLSFCFGKIDFSSPNF